MLHPLPKVDLTRVWQCNADAYYKGTRLILNQGGTSSGKTYSILQLLVFICIYSPTPIVVSVMSESLPHLKLGAVRDFEKIMGSEYRHNQFNKTDFVYDFKPSLGKLEFFSADNAGKVHGPRRDILYVNEVNNVPKPIYDAAAIRTRATIFCDYNPVEHFYLMDEIGRENVAFIKSTYLDAKQFLPIAIVKDIENRKLKDPNWWNVYGLGEVGNVEGLVHPIFNIVDSMPDLGVEFYGLDFGFSNDPTSLVHNKVIEDNLYSDCPIYERGLLTNQLAKKMEECGVRKRYDEIFADCADPKTIAELCEYGFNVKPAPKGEDSIRVGIQSVNQYHQHWTKRSIEAIKEQRNYRYVVDKDGRPTNKPSDSWNHAMDARRYGVVGKESSSTASFGQSTIAGFI